MAARPQVELQALKDQLEVERQLWEANCAKKEVGTAAVTAGRPLPLSTWRQGGSVSGASPGLGPGLLPGGSL